MPRRVRLRRRRLLIPAFISCLGTAWIGTAMAADVSFVAVLKGQHFLQKEADLVCLNDWRMDDTRQGWCFGEDQDSGDQPLVYEVFAMESGPGLITSATVTPPGGAALTLTRMNAGDEEWGREDRFASPMEIDAARPDGANVTNHALHDYHHIRRLGPFGWGDQPREQTFELN